MRKPVAAVLLRRMDGELRRREGEKPVVTAIYRGVSAYVTEVGRLKPKRSRHRSTTRAPENHCRHRLSGSPSSLPQRS